MERKITLNKEKVNHLPVIDGASKRESPFEIAEIDLTLDGRKTIVAYVYGIFDAKAKKELNLENTLLSFGTELGKSLCISFDFVHDYRRIAKYE